MELTGNPAGVLVTAQRLGALALAFEDTAQKCSSDAAIISEGEVTYSDLLAEARKVADRLAAEVPSGSLVMLYEEPNESYIQGLFGTLLAGCSYIPLDHNDPIARVEQVAAQTGCTTIIAGTAQLGWLEVLPRMGEVRLTDRLHLVSFADDPGGRDGRKDRGFRGPEESPIFASCQDEVANVTLTSGSTGYPKAVARSHRAIMKHVEAWEALLSADERRCFALASSLAFSMSMTPIFSTLLRGGTLVMPEVGWHENVRLLAESIARENVTAVKTIPSLLPALAEGLRVRGAMCSDLRVVVMSGEAAYARHVSALRSVLPNVRLFNTYGMTEAFSVTCYEVPRELPTGSGSIPAGFALSGNGIAVLADQSLRECSPDEVGRIYVSGDSLALGLVSQRRLGSLHVTDVNHVAWFGTGDLGRRDESGMVRFVGRRDTLLKIRGYLIDPVEVEVALAEYPGVARTAVAVTPETQQLVALLEFGVDTPDVTSRALRTFLLERLSSFKVPQIFRLVDHMPRLASGKIDRVGLVAIGGDPLDPGERQGPSPGSATEKAVAKLMHSQLGASPQGIDQSWYDLGGDSLGFQVLMSEIEHCFGVRLDGTPGQLTVRECARLVESALITGRTSPRDLRVAIVESVRIDSTEDLRDTRFGMKVASLGDASLSPFTISQRQRLQKLEKMPYDTTYVRIKFAGHADERLVRLSLSYLINAHDALRRTLNLGARQQLTHRVGARGILPWIDARGMLGRRLRQQIDALSGMPLWTDAWPAMRFVLIRRNREDLLVWQLSHTMVDLVSGDVLAQEFIELYTALLEGCPTPSSFEVQDSAGAWDRQMEELVYDDDVVEWTHDMVSRYAEAVAQCKAAVVEQRMQVGSKRHRLARRGTYSEVLLHGILAPSAPVSALLAAYVLACARWLDVTTVPLRVGAWARDYAAFEGDHRRTVGQFNDHYLLAVDVPRGSSVGSIETELSGRMRYIRENSLNFDKVIESLRAREPERFEHIGNFLACGPLGEISARQSTDGTVRTVPRPTWGRASFNPRGEGIKIGCYSFMEDGQPVIHVYAKGLWSLAFSAFVQEFREHLPTRRVCGDALPTAAPE